MKRSAINHTKLKKLCRILDVKAYVAVGLLESLWHLTGREAVAGDIGRMSNEDITTGIDYDGNAEHLIDALFKSGWIDKSAKYRLVVHDWHDHADDGVQKFLKRNHLEFASQDSSDVVETCRDMSRLPMPLPMPLPSPLYTPPDEHGFHLEPPAETRKLFEEDAEKEQSDFDRWFDGEFWQLYPRRVGKAAARRAAKRKLNTPGKRRFAAEMLKKQVPVLTLRGKEYIPYPATWVNRESWNDEIAEISKRKELKW